MQLFCLTIEFFLFRMKKFTLFVLLFLSCAGFTGVFAQCPNPTPQTEGIYPNPLPSGAQNQPYAAQQTTVVFKKDTTITLSGTPLPVPPILVTFTKFTIDQNNPNPGLPTGLSWDYATCNQPNCTYDLTAGQDRACISIAAGTPTQSGTFNPTIRATYVGTFPMPCIGQPPLCVNAQFGLPAEGTIISTDNIPAGLSTFIPAGTIPDAFNFQTTLVIDPASGGPCPATITSSATTVCGGGSVTLTANNMGAAGSYLWQPGGQSTQTITVSPTATTTYTLTTSHAQCVTATATVTITVASAPSASFTASATSVAPGSNVSLTNTSTGATGYEWFINGASFSSQTNTSINIQSAGTSVIRLVATNAAGCKDTFEVTVVASSCPVSVTPTTVSQCGAPAPVTLTATGATSYSWAPATGLSATTGATVTANPGVTTNYTVTGTAAGGCSSTAVVTFTVGVKPNASFTASATSVTPGTTVSLTNTSSGASSYEWYVNGQLIGTTTDASGPIPSAGTYTVRLIASSASGCKDTAEVIIIASACPITVTASVPSVCQGGSATLSASGADTYAWAPATGLSATTGASVIAAPTATTTYTVTGTAAGGCTSTAAVTLSIGATAEFAGLAASYCKNDAAVVTLIGSPAGGVFKIDNVALTANSFSPADYAAGQHTVTYTVAGACGQPDAQNFNIEGPTAAFTPSATNVVVGTTVTLTNSSTGASTYKWFLNEAELGNTANNNVTLSSEGVYTVSLVAYSASGCTDTTAVIINCTTTAIDAELNAAVRIYPNPNNGSFYVESPVLPATVTVTDLLGKNVWTTRLQNNRETLTFSPETAGIYVVRISTAEGDAVRKITVLK